MVLKFQKITLTRPKVITWKQTVYRNDDSNNMIHTMSKITIDC
jgi:polyphosphate kinase